jgi:hypothetical protein
VATKPEFPKYPGWPGYDAIRRYAPPARARRVVRGSADADAHALEWKDRPLGWLGRRLLPEIEAYLEFFAISGA